jgi:hypothetical protein
LVTTDSDFYKDRTTTNGLAAQLLSELASQKASVFAYPSLTKLIDHLAEFVPARDEKVLVRRIAEAARSTLAAHADWAGFVLGEPKQWRISVTQAGMPLKPFVTFDLTYSQTNKSEQDAVPGLIPN